MAASWYEFRSFSRETVHAARRWYTRFLPTEGRLLDLGCGRGEFLDIAHAAGLRVEGVDGDAAMLAHVEAHVVHRQDVLDFLQSTPDSYESISALHLVEHLEVDQTATLIRLAASQLASGGVLVLATPNPGSLPTIMHEFWRDPTHTRPYDVELLTFLCRQAGLDVTDAGVNPESERGLPVELDDLKLRFAGPPDEPDRGSRPGAPARWIGGQVAGSAYGHDLEAAIHRLRLEHEHTRDELERIAGLLGRFLDVAYQPSENYVVARKR